MAIRNVRPHERDDFVAFLSRGLRPEGGATRLQDDFPVALGPENLAGMYGYWDGGELVAGLTVLVREYTTSLGALAVAGVGSVVTRADRRGRGLSGRLQAAVLADLRGQDVPLAVLWTDQPEVYAGRGFRDAGWEHHADLAALAADRPAGDLRPRPYRGDDLAPVTALYERHLWHARRRRGDHAALYGMPGTRGVVVETPRGEVCAYAFAGKGADFPGYVAEWGGEPAAAAVALADVAGRGWAHRALVPQGGEALLALLDARGAERVAVASGMWSVLDPAVLERACARAGLAGAAARGADPADPRAWLGAVGQDGRAVAGPLRLAVWGFDSV